MDDLSQGKTLCQTLGQGFQEYIRFFFAIVENPQPFMAERTEARRRHHGVGQAQGGVEDFHSMSR
jgi:hypothetical protein